MEYYSHCNFSQVVDTPLLLSSTLVTFFFPAFVSPLDSDHFLFYLCDVLYYVFRMKAVASTPEMVQLTQRGSLLSKMILDSGKHAPSFLVIYCLQHCSYLSKISCC